MEAAPRSSDVTGTRCAKLFVAQFLFTLASVSVGMLKKLIRDCVLCGAQTKLDVLTCYLEPSTNIMSRVCWKEIKYRLTMADSSKVIVSKHHRSNRMLPGSIGCYLATGPNVPQDSHGFVVAMACKCRSYD